MAELASPAPIPPPPPAPPATITIDDFRRVVLKVGKVLEATDHPKADRLLVLKVDVGGGEVRQIVAGVKAWYAPAQLVGKNVIIAANLQTALLRGMESQGMMLATTSGQDVIVLTTEKEAVPGSRVT
jgi:methionyl-tRNA synthetase